MVGAVAMVLRAFGVLMRGGWTEWTQLTEWTVVRGVDSIIVAIGLSWTTPSNSREALTSDLRPPTFARGPLPTRRSTQSRAAKPSDLRPPTFARGQEPPRRGTPRRAAT